MHPSSNKNPEGTPAARQDQMGNEEAGEKADEEAEVEPAILSPNEMAERASRAAARSGALNDAGGDLDLEAPQNPLRMPGAMSRRRERWPGRGHGV